MTACFTSVSVANRSLSVCFWKGLERWRILGHMLITGLVTGYGPTAGREGYGLPS